MSTPSTMAAAPAAGTGPRREVLEALSGLFLGLFVTILSSTVVSSSLPVIVSDIGGGQSAYTWVVTATLLATTVSTPIWGKLADLFYRKLLVQIGLVIFVVGSALAGLSARHEHADRLPRAPGSRRRRPDRAGPGRHGRPVSPRERGRYMGYLGAVIGVGTVGRPADRRRDHRLLGWRWYFYIGVPIAVFAIVVLQRTLHLPRDPSRGPDRLPRRRAHRRRRLALLIWVSLAGKQFDWVSGRRALMLAGALALLGAGRLVERRAAEPLIPLHLFSNRTVVLAVIASSRRHRDVRRVGLPQPVPAARPRPDPDRVAAC